MAVVVSVAAILSTLSMLKNKPFFAEIYYVWCLKMELNFINAKLRQVEAAAAKENVIAIQTLGFYYRASRQLWLLDDNTIAIDSLNLKEQRLKEQAAHLNLTISPENYEREHLKQF